MDQNNINLLVRAYINGCIFAKSCHSEIDINQELLMKETIPNVEFNASKLIQNYAVKLSSDQKIVTQNIFDSNYKLRNGESFFIISQYEDSNIYKFFHILLCYPHRIPLFKLVELSYLIGLICTGKGGVCHNNLFRIFEHGDMANIYNHIKIANPFN